MKHAVTLVLALSISLPAGAQVGAAITESPITDAILTSGFLEQIGVSTQTLATLGQVVTVAQQSLETARATSEALRTAYDSVKSFQNIGDGGDFDVFDTAANLFFNAFPEAKAAMQDAAAIKNNVTYMAEGGSPGGFDPYRFLQLIADMQNSGESAYNTLHSVDDLAYNLGGEHLAVVEHIDALKADIEAMAREANLPIEAHDIRSAAVLQARLTARNAAANAEATRMQAELVRQGKLNYTAKRAAAVKASASLIDQMKGFSQTVGTQDGLADPYAELELAPSTVDKFVPRGLE